MKIKLILIIFTALLFAPQVQAAVSFTGSSYASSSRNLIDIVAGTAETVIFWGYKLSDTNLDFAFSQDATGLNTKFAVIQRGAGGANNLACQGATGIADAGVKPSYNIWNGYACSFDGTNATIYKFDQNCKFVASGGSTITTAGTADGISIAAAVGGTNIWNGSIANMMFFNSSLTQKQIQNELCNRHPYILGFLTDVFFPLVNIADNRGFGTGVERVKLTFFGTPTTVNGPSIPSLYPF